MPRIACAQASVWEIFRGLSPQTCSEEGVGSGTVPPQTVGAYLIDELCQVADVEARQRLRSISSSSLIVSRTRLSTVGDRAFPVAAARIWNSLPDHDTSAPSVAGFRSRLKTHLFNISYPSPLWLYSAWAVTLSCFWHYNRSCLLTYLLTDLFSLTLEESSCSGTPHFCKSPSLIAAQLIHCICISRHTFLTLFLINCSWLFLTFILRDGLILSVYRRTISIMMMMMMMMSLCVGCWVRLWWIYVISCWHHLSFVLCCAEVPVKYSVDIYVLLLSS